MEYMPIKSGFSDIEQKHSFQGEGDIRFSEILADLLTRRLLVKVVLLHAPFLLRPVLLQMALHVAKFELVDCHSV